MATSTGKTIATVKLSDGSIISIFNKSMEIQTQDIKYIDMYGKVRYTVTVPQQYMGRNYRCAQFSRYFSQSTGQSKYPSVLIYVPGATSINNVTGITALPLYQLICPSIFKQSQEEYMITWWSNIENSNDIVNNIYNWEVIRKFTYYQIENFLEDANPTQLLCGASLRFQLLKQQGAGVDQKHCSLVPIIYNPFVLQKIENRGWVTDFSTGGSGNGGASVHTHTDMSQGGFAAAVFMPSASMKPLNWR